MVTGARKMIGVVAELAEGRLTRANHVNAAMEIVADSNQTTA